MADRVAVLGIGLMGAPMARRLLAAGFEVTVWNRSREKAEPLGREGATVAETPAQAVAEADIVDAPVSGGTVGAEQGTLAIMAGGEAADIEAARPLFEAMGRVTHVGPSGAGQLVKLANQTIVAVNIGAVAEALLLAAAGGADPAAARSAMQGGFADSRILDVHGQRMLDRDFAPRGRVAIHLKDLETIVAEAEAMGLELPLARMMRDRFRRMVEELELAETDHSAVLLELEAGNRPHRVGQRPDRLA